MKEYHGKSARAYGQVTTIQAMLMPALERHIPDARRGMLLDVGCGHGDLFPIAKARGYDYAGLDISPDMLQEAKRKYPSGRYVQGSSTEITKRIHRKADVIVCNMVLPALVDVQEISATLQEMKAAAKPDGVILIGTTYPAYDGYMQAGLLGRQGVRTEFSGYFSSGTPYATEQIIGDHTMIFEDMHWTFSDYFHWLRTAGLILDAIDECPPDIKLADAIFAAEKRKYPKYLLLQCSPKAAGG